MKLCSKKKVALEHIKQIFLVFAYFLSEKKYLKRHFPNFGRTFWLLLRRDFYRKKLYSSQA